MGRRFRNWGQTHACVPAAWSAPGSEDELAALVAAAAGEGRRVKPVGAGHSWSDVALTDGVLVSLDRMQRPLSLDRDAGTVTVEAGMRLHQLNDWLAGEGLAVPIQGSVSAQSIGGLIATGTHGSSLRHGNLSTLVEGLHMVCGGGRRVELREGDERLEGARLGLGLLGIVTRVTLRVVPAFRLLEEVRVLSWPAALEQLLEVARREEYVKWFWLPHTGFVAEFRYRAVDEPGSLSRVGRWLDEHLINRFVFAGVLSLGALIPALIPASNRAVRRAYFREGRRIGRGDRVLGLAMPPVHRETEWSVPLEHGPEAAHALALVIEQGSLRVNFIQELRVVRADRGWMSPAFGRDSLHVGAYVGHGRHADAYLHAASCSMQAMGARPHWGKEAIVSADYLARVYPEYARFCALRAALDPDGTFDNAFSQRCFPRA